MKMGLGHTIAHYADSPTGEQLRKEQNGEEHRVMAPLSGGLNNRHRLLGHNTISLQSDDEDEGCHG